MDKVILPDFGSKIETRQILKTVKGLRELKELGGVIESLHGQGILTDDQAIVANKTRWEKVVHLSESLN